jgi:hypothetical protein
LKMLKKISGDGSKRVEKIEKGKDGMEENH